MIFQHEPIEWDDEIIQRIEELEEKAEECGLSREERVLMDVFETIRLLESDGDGLHEFWHSPLNHNRIIKSFDMLGASAVVDAIQASQWCQTRHEDRDDYTESEAEYLSGIEEELFDGLLELPDLVAEFIEDELDG